VIGTVLRRTAAIVVTAGLAFGLLAGAAGAATKAKSPVASSTVCTHLRRRLAGAPATLRRVDANLQELQALLPNVRLPARRAVVEQRIQRLEQLRTALSTRIEDARAACGTTGNTT
jgi:hypothetical protein